MKSKTPKYACAKCGNVQYVTAPDGDIYRAVHDGIYLKIVSVGPSPLRLHCSECGGRASPDCESMAEFHKLVGERLSGKEDRVISLA